jgi:predicted transglutaminase-like cysteine proteinase
MKAQIAIIAGGLAIAAGVAYAELKPASTAPTMPATSQSSDPNGSTAQQTQPNSQSNGQSAPSQNQQKLTNPNTNSNIRPKVPSGGGEGGEGREGGEHGGWFGFGEDDD